jgi:hypothetical protein
VQPPSPEDSRHLVPEEAVISNLQNRAEKAEAALADRDRQVRELSKALAGRRQQAILALPAGLWRSHLMQPEQEMYRDELVDLILSAFTQPSSNPPQQDREEEYTAVDQREFARSALRNLVAACEAIYLQWPTGDKRQERGEREFKTALAFARNTLDESLTQPEADPEIPRCGGSGKFDATDDSLAAEHGTEVCPGCPDCQPTPELLGEEAVKAAGDELIRYMVGERGSCIPRQMSPAAKAAWEEAIREAAADAMEPVLAKALAAARPQPVSESPGDSGEEWPDDKLVLLVRFKNREHEDPWRAIPGDLRPHFEKSGEYEVLEVVDRAEAERHVNHQRELKDRAEELLLTQPLPGNSGGEEEGLLEAIRRDLRSESEESKALAGPLGAAIEDASGSSSLEFCTPEQVAQGICTWLEAWYE